MRFNSIGPKALLILAGVALAACETTQTAGGSGGSGGTTGGTTATTPTQTQQRPATTIRPGSAEDFVANVGDRVFFDTDRFDLKPAARATLDKQAAWLRQYPNARLVVEGHADERGTREYNLALGDRRANAVRNYLVSQGVAPSRLTTISYGKERPVALGSNEAAWAQNRRSVSVVATPGS